LDKQAGGRELEVGPRRRDEGALKRLFLEIEEIEDYLEGKVFNPTKQCERELQQNLVSFESNVSPIQGSLQ
jgi:hypothetical protein